MSAEDYYDWGKYAPTWVMRMIFERFHDLGHLLAEKYPGKLSDSPYPRSTRMEKKVPDSDKWMRLVYPSIWKIME